MRLIDASANGGLPVSSAGYHQQPEILPRMIATTTLPWGEGMKLH